MKNTALYEREKMTEEEKELFLSDLRGVCGEYFEADGKYSVDTAATDKGVSVCVIFDAARIRRFKKPR